MRIGTSPQGLHEGKKWLAALKSKVCPNFRAYLGYIKNAVACGAYTYEDLGASLEEILELALVHAAEDAREAYPHQLRIKNDLLCELSKVRGAHRPPDYADTLLPLQPQQEPIIKLAA